MLLFLFLTPKNLAYWKGTFVMLNVFLIRRLLYFVLFTLYMLNCQIKTRWRINLVKEINPICYLKYEATA